MGKKVKNKGRNPGKAQSRSTVSSSPRATAATTKQKQADPMAQVLAEEDVDREPCQHYDKGSAQLNQILSRIRSSSMDARCHDCRDDPGNRRGSKGKGKGNRKKGGNAAAVEGNSESGVIWVCLSCGHLGCGGGVNDLVPYGHARRHLKQGQHSLAVQLDNPLTCWCFPCDSLIPIEMPEGLNLEVKSTKDGGDVERGKEGNEGEVLALDAGKGYAVRGLMNLGNTCFLNSVMQNLFAMDMLRDYFSSLTETVGPLTMSLKKLFSETGAGMESNRSIVNPKNLFGCICSKAPQFKGYQQQDSHELLRYLLDGLCTEELTARKSQSSNEDKTNLSTGSSFVDVMFGGQLSSTVCCMECGHMSVVYEPFLDLSLPVPAKKIPPKKVSVALTKKNKLSSRDGPKGRRAREKGSIKLSALDQCKLESVDVPSESGEQSKTEAGTFPAESSESFCSPVTGEEQTTSVAPADDTWWMDYVEPNETPVDFSLAHQTDDSVSNDYEMMLVCQSMTDVQPNPEPQVDISFKEQPVTLGSCGETSEGSLQVQDSKGLPSDQELVSTAEKKPAATVESPIVYGCELAPTSYYIGCEPAEPVFDGLGDLFAEPEATSNLKKETGTVEDAEASWFDGISSESNPEEVDNTDAPVSVDSCLSYFTKPELLSDEHAWHCENCSKILQQQNTKNRRVRQQDNPMDSVTVTSDSEVKADQVRSKIALSSLDEDSIDSSESKILENGNGTILEGNLDPPMDSHGETNVNAGTSKDLLNLTGSDGMVCMSKQSRAKKSSPLTKEKCCDVSEEEEGNCIAESDVSQYFSCTSSVEKNSSEVSSSHPDLDSCSRGELNDDGCEVQSLEILPKTTVDNRDSNGQKTSENGSCKNVQKVRKKGAKMLTKVHNSEDENESERLKAKRDATKRILISKGPAILTIHLKRFSQDACGRLNKLSGHVSFQEFLDLTPYMDPRCSGKEKYSYRLVGAVEHLGNMRSGHYVAYVRGERNRGKVEKDGVSSKWFYTSDWQVREVPLTEVLRSDAYLLFYERVQH